MEKNFNFEFFEKNNVQLYLSKFQLFELLRVLSIVRLTFPKDSILVLDEIIDKVQQYVDFYKSNS